jgi:glutamate transport system substrate-binding protein
MSRRRWVPIAAMAMVIALAGAGCGGDDEGGGSEETSQGSGQSQKSFEAGTTMARIADKGEIRIGVKYDVPPFGFKNPRNNQIEGFDIDFGKAVAQELGVKPTFVEAISDNRIPFITDGTVDLVLSTMTINEERAQEIGFTDPYFIARGRILTKEGSDIKGVDDLAGKKVCTALGSTYEETLKKQAPRADLRLVDTYSECLELIQNGAVDAVSTDDVILTGMIIQDDSLALVPGDELTVEPYGGGFKRGDTKFAEFLNGVLEKYKTDGRWQQAYDKWLGQYTKEEQKPPDATLEQALQGEVT